MRRLISVIIAALLLLAMTVICFADEDIAMQRLENEVVANEQYNLLLQELNNQIANTAAKSANVDYYGGAYVNDDGNLVVCVTSSYNERSGVIQAYTNNEDIILKTVQYPYSTLLQEQTDIGERYEALRDASLLTTATTANLNEDSEAVELIYNSLCGTYIDEENNKLVVEIEGLSAEKISAFKTVFSNAEYIEFVEGYRFTETATVLKSGGAIKPNTGYFSIGYPAKYTSPDGSLVAYGFVTAGHAVSAGDNVYTTDGTLIGYCVLSHGGRADSAFIWVTNSNYAVSNVTAYSGISLNTSSYTVPAQGTTIYKEAAATGYTYGKVVSTSASRTTSSGVYYYDMIETNVYCLPGDSGGVAYTGSGYIVGTIAGADYTDADNPSANTFKYSYIAKVANELDVLYCELY